MFFVCFGIVFFGFFGIVFCFVGVGSYVGTPLEGIARAVLHEDRTCQSEQAQNAGRANRPKTK